MDVNDITLLHLSVSNTVNVRWGKYVQCHQVQGNLALALRLELKFSLCATMQSSLSAEKCRITVFLYSGYANRKVSKTVNAESINPRARSKERLSTIWNAVCMTFDKEMLLMTSQRRGSFMNSLQLRASEKKILYISLFSSTWLTFIIHQNLKFLFCVICSPSSRHADQRKAMQLFSDTHSAETFSFNDLPLTTSVALY